MTTPDDLFRQAQNRVQRLGLREIPFTESPSDLSLTKVFTGRQRELGQVFNLFQSRERRRILVYGNIGIGKSAFLLEVLSVLRRQRPQMLTTYISLPPGLDLATTALIALALEMPDDEWAQRQLYQMGIPPERAVKERTSTAGANMVFQGTMSEKDLAPVPQQYPSVSLNQLLERARQHYPDGVLIAIDDLDKRNPAEVRQMMHDAQGVLKGPAWFMLTGHPQGITRDLLTSERGLFDLQLPLTAMDQPTMQEMLVNYLNSARDRQIAFGAPQAFHPFTPDAARQLCQASQGQPRTFNRFGAAALNTAIEAGADRIDPPLLARGLENAQRTLLDQAALNFIETRIWQLLQEKGSLTEENIDLADLRLLGLGGFNELVPFLEKFSTLDLARRLPQSDVAGFEPVQIPNLDDLT
ncbi:MAG: AAA family ATPase [Cyanobacteriota bacterium]|jgi:hypothetical protein